MKTMTKTMFGFFCAILMATVSQAQETGETVLSNGLKYVGTPYVAHTLDVDGPEELILNCDEVDCTTFVEYVLAESLCPKLDNGDISEGVFADKLQQIRYRNGQIDGYTSRLHYITEWVNNAVQKGFLKDVTAVKSSMTEKVALSYMSSHPQLYKQLANSEDNVAQMKAIEKALSGQVIHYLPKEQLPYNGLAWIKNGDIIAITTNIPGLDVSHLGIAFYVEGKLTLLHASSKERKVVVSKKTLSQMLKDNDKSTGIRVLRIAQ